MKTSLRPTNGKSRRWISKRVLNSGLVVLAGASLMVGASLGLSQTIPTNALPTTLVPAPQFASWFTLGVPSLNGGVDPADSLAFSNIPNADFYRWSWQMFLWLTSPATGGGYGTGGFIFTSPVFFDVSPPDPSGLRHFSMPTAKQNGTRTLTRHVPGKLTRFGVRVAALGPHNLPVIITKDGKIYEIAPTTTGSSGRPIITDGAGRQMEVGKIVVGADKKAIFLDTHGKSISNPKAVFDRRVMAKIKANATPTDSANMVQKFTVGKNSYFVGRRGMVINVEVNQAGNGVLMSQAGSLVYYASMVNDVYAYFLTGTKDGGIAPTPANSVVVGGTTIFRFPTDAVGLNEVTTFAAANGVTFPDPKALCVELKTSWVDASTVPNPSQYIIQTGIVPVYDTTNPNNWVQIGQTQMKLALVGMHVVGSTRGHPEMLWASFEHFGNSPNTAYTYLDTFGNPTPSPFDPGPWTFSSVPGGPFNVQHMSYNSSTGDITSIFPFSVSPSDTMRMFPFGMAPGAAGSNSDIISIDNSVLSQLIPGDLRANYFMIGTTWTAGGLPPNGTNEVGTRTMSNTTMETYQQGSNCFGCHVSTPTSPVATVDVSHIFGPLQPLF